MTQVQTQRVVRLDGSSQLVEVPDPAPAVIGDQPRLITAA